MNILSSGLDSVQQAVASAEVTERMLVVAGPGTGKTQVSAVRLSRLLDKGLLPSQILVLCFSRSAVRTLTRRLESLAPASEDLVENLRHLSIRTFDSWAFRLLRMSGLQPRDLMRGSFDENIDRLVGLIREGQSEPLRTLLAKIRHVVIDEAQDIGGVRLALVKCLLAQLAPPERSGVGFTILGDDAQAIYQFAARTIGSDDSILERCMDHVRETYDGQLREVELQKNYRAGSELAEATAALRSLFSAEVDNSVRLSEMERFVAELSPVWNDMLSPLWLARIGQGSLAILTRTNGEALRIVNHLNGKQSQAPDVPVHLHVAGASAPVPAWIAALLWQVPADTVSRSLFRKIYSHISVTCGEPVCRALSLPPEELAWLRLVRACGLADDEKSFAMQALRERMTWPDAFPDDQLVSDAGVLVTTIHQSKGLEFDNVVLLQKEIANEAEENEVVDDDATEAEIAGDLQQGVDAGEEASVLFVGVTRAAHHVGRLPRASIYAPYRGKQFSGGRRRQLTWWNGWVNIEIGMAGDVSSASFVDTALHGSVDSVRAVQQLLLSRAAELRGHKVMLCRFIQKVENESPHVYYDIHIQEGAGPGQLLGRTCSQLTFDLKKLLGSKRPLPWRIMNLRIGNIVSIPAPAEIPHSIPEPWRNSRLWLGISLCGTGDFKT